MKVRKKHGIYCEVERVWHAILCNDPTDQSVFFRSLYFGFFWVMRSKLGGYVGLNFCCVSSYLCPSIYHWSIYLN